MNKLISERLSIVEVVSASFQLFFRNIKDIAIITLIFAFPTAIAEFCKENTSIIGHAITLATLLFLTIGLMAIIKLIYFDLKGDKITWQEAVRDVLPRSGKGMLAIILAILIVGLGTVLLIIPGIIAAVSISLCLQFIVLEKTGVTESLKKSNDLLEGEKWDVFLEYLVVMLITGGISYGLSKIGITFGETFSPIVIITSLIDNLFSAVGIITSTIIYLNLKATKKYDLVIE